MSSPALEGEVIPEVVAPPVGDGPRKTRWNQWRFPPNPALIEQIYGEVYFEGPMRDSGLNRFFTLLILAAMIAAFGLYTDSVLVVVAAMLINPMMTPIMGFTIGLVTGRMDRQLTSAGIVAIATGLAVGIGWLGGELMPRVTAIPSEVMSRTEPKLIDLVIAIVSGIAGAYALVRKDANTALPGVAVAISLMTPLVATGLLISYGDMDLAWGTFLLFLLNLAAIVFSGSIVFVSAGFLPIYDFRNLPRRIKLGLLTAAAGILIVAVALGPTSTNLVLDATEEDAIGVVISDWIEEDGTVESLGYDLRRDTLIVNLTGPSMPANVRELRAQLQPTVSEDVTIEVRFFQFQPLIMERGTGEGR